MRNFRIYSNKLHEKHISLEGIEKKQTPIIKSNKKHTNNDMNISISRIIDNYKKKEASFYQEELNNFFPNQTERNLLINESSTKKGKLKNISLNTRTKSTHIVKTKPIIIYDNVAQYMMKKDIDEIKNDEKY